MFYVLSGTKTIAADPLSSARCEEGSPRIRFVQMSVPQVNYAHAPGHPPDLKNVIHQTKQPSSIAPLSISDAQGLQHYSWPLPLNKNVTRQLVSTFQIVLMLA